MGTRFFLCLFMIAGICNAQVDADEMAEYQTETMKKYLELDQGQEELITEINGRYAKQQADLINSEGSFFGKIGDMKRIGQAKNEELEKILTKEQFKTYEDKVMPEMRGYMRQKRQ